MFVSGFAASDRDDVATGECLVPREAAAQMLTWRGAEVAILVRTGKWTAVKCDGQDIQKQALLSRRLLKMARPAPFNPRPSQF